MVRESAE
jgi:hypothetical protein